MSNVTRTVVIAMASLLSGVALALASVEITKIRSDRSIETTNAEQIRDLANEVLELTKVVQKIHAIIPAK